MTREEQDKLWADLSEESKEQMRDRYNKPIEDTDPNAEYYRGIRYQTGLMFGKHNLKPSLTYEDVARELFKYGAWQPAEYASKYYLDRDAEPTYCLNYTSQKQAEKLEAINKLLNVAKFLNKNEDGSEWVPDFNDEFKEVYTLGIDPTDNSVNVVELHIQHVSTEIVYFRTKEISQQAIQILGEDVVRTALTTEY